MGLIEKKTGIPTNEYIKTRIERYTGLVMNIPKKDTRNKLFSATRKNFLPTIIIIVGLWLLLATMFFFVDPTNTGSVVIFLVLLFLALFFSLSLLLANTRTGAVITIAITLYMALAAANLGNTLNLLLITGSALAFEIYFRTNT